MTRILLQADEATAHASPPGMQIGLALAVVFLVALAGIMSGLTLGLLSLDRLDLEVMLRTGNKKQQKFARRLTPMVEHPHWVLSTLVICNTLAGMALPLCLDRLLNVAAALVLSSTAIVLFGEIIPQAICSRYGLSIGGHAAPVVRLLMWVTVPLSWPIAKALDLALGKEDFTFGKRQIRAFVDLHRESAGMGGPLNEEEFHVIQGVLDLGRKKAFKAMTPLEKVFMLSTDDILDRPTLRRILDTGHSRIPVYNGTNKHDIVGLILVKELLAVVGLAPPGTEPVRVTTLKMRDLPALPEDILMTDLLNLFQTGHSHMALLVQAPSKPESRRPSAHHHSSSSSTSSAGSLSSSSCSSDDGSGSSSTCSDSDSSDGHTGTPKSSRSRGVSHLLQCLSSKGSKRFRKRSTSHGSSHDGTAAAATAVTATIDNEQGSVALELADTAHIPQIAVPQVAVASTAPGSSSDAHTADSSPTQLQQVVIEMGSGPGGAAAAASLQGGSNSDWRITAMGSHAAMPATAAAPAAAAAAAATGKDDADQSRAHHHHHRHHHHHEGGDHDAVRSVSFAANVPVGIITLEDVLEELMQEEIVDETDTFIDNEKTCRVNARVLSMSLPPALRRLLLASQQQHLQQWQQQQPVTPAAAGTLPSSAAAMPSVWRSSPTVAALARTSPEMMRAIARKSMPLQEK